MIIDIAKVLIPAMLTFTIGIAITPVLTHYLYEYKVWRKKARDRGLGGVSAPIFNRLHKEKEVGTPLMGGIVVWGSVFLTISAIWLIAFLFPNDITSKIEFLSRSQTWLPLFTLVVASLIGLLDDFLVVNGMGKHVGGGIELKTRITAVLAIGAVGAWWFFVKLGVSSISIPFNGELEMGLLFIPFFMIVMVALFSGGVIDGIDGLSGGVFAAIFSAYGTIAYFQDQIDLAALSFAIVGGLLAFLWFNIPPARFYLSETGTLGLTTTLAVIAFLTHSVIVLLIIALPLFISSGSVIIQQLSKKFRNGKKVFLVAPIHHHFEAIGWPGYKVTMRFWILSMVCATTGVIIALMG